MDELENVLRRYRPAGPLPALRDRVVHPPRRRWREWLAPAAAAAAALLFYALTDSTHRRVISATSPSNAGREAAIADMAAELGGDEAARLEAERLIRKIESEGINEQARGTAAIEESIP